MIEAAQARGADDVRWVLLDPGASNSLPFESHRFDCVIASSVLEYLSDVGTTLSEIKRVLKPGGWMIASVPDERDPQRSRERRLRRLLRVVPRRAIAASPRLSNFAEYLELSKNRYDQGEWMALIEAAGFVVSPLRYEGPLLLLEASGPAPR
jgi:ubiquinone/menaquinone biosynthesis C-methylase UbiE